MRERPILFSGPLVRAILDGRKTVTRRLVKPQPQYIGGARGEADPSNWGWETECGAFVVMGGDFRPYQGDDYSHTSESYLANCPHGAPGDRLWVRETWAEVFRDVDGCPANWGEECSDYNAENDHCTTHEFIEYRADTGNRMPGEWDWEDREATPMRWRPSIHMPRWASRIDLEIVSVRAERLQDVTHEDAIREGCAGRCDGGMAQSPRWQFADLWDAINGKRPGAPWADNPWVWRIEFRRVRP